MKTPATGAQTNNAPKIIFANNGKPYSFDFAHNWHNGTQPFSEIRTIELKEQSDNIDRAIGNRIRRALSIKEQKEYVIEMHLTSWRGEGELRTIAVTTKEADWARYVVQSVNAFLAAKRAAEAEQQEKIRISKERDVVDLIDENGNKTKIWIREHLHGDYVLIADGGSTYHTHADCFQNWKSWMQSKFCRK